MSWPCHVRVLEVCFTRSNTFKALFPSRSVAILEGCFHPVQMQWHYGDRGEDFVVFLSLLQAKLKGCFPDLNAPPNYVTNNRQGITAS